MAARLTEVISHRLTPADRLLMERLKATFPEAGWRATYEWIIDLPGVRDQINQRIESNTP